MSDPVVMTTFKKQLFECKPTDKTVILPDTWQKIENPKKQANDEQLLSWMEEYHCAEMSTIERKELKGEMATISWCILEKKVKAFGWDDC